MERLYKNGLVIGRFDPVHIGHNKLINESLKRCERTLVLVGSAQESGTLRNPLPLSMRIRLIRQSHPGIPEQALLIKGINITTSANKHKQKIEEKSSSESIEIIATIQMTIIITQIAITK